MGSDASYAVDRNTATCMKTRPIGTNSPNKRVWWKVDLGGVYSIQSINILFKNYNGYEDRQRGRFAGFSLYVSNSGDVQESTRCYKDGPQLPPLNFTIACAESGRFVIFYNERLDGGAYHTGYELENVYIELCEVIVQGCNYAGFYGSNCDIPCPINCKDSTCHILGGACFMCKAGWTTVHCNKTCIEGWHGLNCSQQCVGHCRNGAACNHVTGQCDTGCAAGWTGVMCDNECDDRTYGYNCVNNCSGHCLNNSPCNKQTGNCDKGCDPGYTNSDCSKGRTENLLMKQDISSCIIFVIGLSISILINLILISCGILLCRRINSNRLNVSCRPVSCWKKSVYQDIVVKTDAASTYQELDISDSAYQNTTIRRQT